MDIKTLADLINEFISAKNDILIAQDIKHPTTIGSMYEGLTQSVLESSIFTGLDRNHSAKRSMSFARIQ